MGKTPTDGCGRYAAFRNANINSGVNSVCSIEDIYEVYTIPEDAQGKYAQKVSVVQSTTEFF